jgi:hypothetical protein
MSSETEPQAGSLVTATACGRKQSLLEAAEDPALTINLVWVETCSDNFLARVRSIAAEIVNPSPIVLSPESRSSPAEGYQIVSEQ